MAPKLLWITIIHVLSGNLIFSLSESIEFNKDGETSLSNLRDRVRYTTHIRDCLKKSPLVIDLKNYESLSGSGRVDGFENPDLAKDLSKPIRHVKRHAISRCNNILAQENNEPNNKPADPTTSEWQMKSTPVDDPYGNLYDHSTILKSKFADLKKIDFNSHKVVHQEPPLHHTVPVIQRVDFNDKNSKLSQLQSSLQDKRNKIKSLISTPQHKLGEILQDKLFDESLHNKLAQPSLTLPLTPQFIKYPVISPLTRPAEIPNNVDTAAVLTTDNDNQSNPSKPSPPSPQYTPVNNFYQKDLIAENKPFLSLPPIQFNKPKPVDISYDKRVPPVAYLPKPPQFIQIPAVKPKIPPIFIQKEPSISPANERPQPNIGWSSPSYPTNPKPTINEREVSFSLPHNKQHNTFINFSPAQVKKTPNTETVNKPIAVIEKKVSFYFPHKKPQEFIGLSPPTTQLVDNSDAEPPHKPILIDRGGLTPVFNEQKKHFVDLSPPTTQLVETPDAETPHKPIVIDRGDITAAFNEQKKHFVDLLQQAPQLVNIPDKETLFYPATPAGQTTVPGNVPYVQKQPIISLPPTPQITETFNGESTPQSLPIENEVSVSTPYGQQQPTVNYLPPPPPPQLPQIKIQKEISIPLPYPKPKVGAPLKLIKTFNAELISQSISQQKKNALNNQQQPMILPSPPPLTKTTTSDYAN